MNWEIGLIGGFGMAIAIGLGWLYFDFVSHRTPREEKRWHSIWMYAHLPVTIGIAATGAAVLYIVEHAEGQLTSEVRWLLVCAIAMDLMGIAMIRQTLQSHEQYQQTYRTGQTAMLIVRILIMSLCISNVQTISLLAIVVVLMILPVFFGFLAWLRRINKAQNNFATQT